MTASLNPAHAKSRRRESPPGGGFAAGCGGRSPILIFAIRIARTEVTDFVTEFVTGAVTDEIRCLVFEVFSCEASEEAKQSPWPVVFVT